MAHQINLYSPALLAPQQRLSAQSMAQALALLAGVLIVASLWLTMSDENLRRAARESALSQAAERDRMTQALASRPVTSGDAIAQELAQVQQQISRRQAMLDELNQGRIVAGQSHAAMLKMVSRTVPSSVWLKQIRLVDGRLDVSGFTLQPDALRPWLVDLASHPLTAAQQLSAVSVDRIEAADAGVAGPAEVWSFRLVSQKPAASKEARP
jgi:Tfp pilus assembly protein PilN